jgi:hypothetical protein
MLTDISNRPGYFLSVPRWDKHLSIPGSVIHTVKLQDVPLCYLMKTKQEQLPGVAANLPRDGL